MAERAKPWYYDYPKYLAEVEKRRTTLAERCKELGVDARGIIFDFSKDLIARAVFESNWTEGIELSYGKTRELNEIVFADFHESKSPHLDTAKILNDHKKRVVALKRKKVSYEELAATNLSAAYLAMTFVAVDMLHHYSGYLVKLTRQVAAAMKEKAPENPELREQIEKLIEAVRAFEQGDEPMIFPVTHGLRTQAEFMASLCDLKDEDLQCPMRKEHIHLLHRILFMGIFPSAKCGIYRRTPVNVGNPTLFFPPWKAVPALMEEYAKTYPYLSPALASDRILPAAKASHNFVAIHPYSDGNGRISRLIMNLAMWGYHPPVFLKADAKGRKRYFYALRRADRGQYEPLACLIARSLIETYDSMLVSLASRKENGSKANSETKE